MPKRSVRISQLTGAHKTNANQMSHIKTDATLLKTKIALNDFVKMSKSLIIYLYKAIEQKNLTF